MFKRKTTQSILDTFTNDLHEVVDRENAIAAQTRQKIIEAEALHSAAVNESSRATLAIENITALFTGE